MRAHHQLFAAIALLTTAACSGGAGPAATDDQTPGAQALAELPAESRWTAPSWPATPVTGLLLWRTGDGYKGRLMYSGVYFEGTGRVTGSTLALTLHYVGDPQRGVTTFEGTLEANGRLRARVNGGGAKGGYDVELVRDP